MIADVAGGPYWLQIFDILERGGGRYVWSRAIAGPSVAFDLRDLTLLGSTVVPPEVIVNFKAHVEAGEPKPALAATYKLDDLRDAQAAFIAKKHIGIIAVCP
ncbi:MAG: hypothetical protein AB8B58_02630 [Roseobacter sp.]